MGPYNFIARGNLAIKISNSTQYPPTPATNLPPRGAGVGLDSLRNMGGPARPLHAYPYYCASGGKGE